MLDMVKKVGQKYCILDIKMKREMVKIVSVVCTTQCINIYETIRKGKLRDREQYRQKEAGQVAQPG